MKFHECLLRKSADSRVNPRQSPWGLQPARSKRAQAYWSLYLPHNLLQLLAMELQDFMFAILGFGPFPFSSFFLLKLKCLPYISGGKSTYMSQWAVAIIKSSKRFALCFFMLDLTCFVTFMWLANKRLSLRGNFGLELLSIAGTVKILLSARDELNAFCITRWI